MAVVNSDSDGRNKLESEINELENVSSGGSSTRVTLDPIVYDAPSDESIAETAENKLSSYKEQSINAIKTESEENAKALNNAKTSYVTGMYEDLEALGTQYDKAAQSIDNDVLKRGLARSSIAVNAKSALEGDYAKQAANVRTTYGNKIAELDAQIASLDVKLQEALNNFNLTYAVKLNDTIAELKAEREKKMQEALKYNNQIKIQQAKLDADSNKTSSGLGSLSADERDAIYKAVYQKMDEYLASLSAEQARLEIRNHTLYRDHLSDYYYYALYEKYGR